MEYVELEEAKRRGGLRLVLTAGVPGPWGEAAKGLLFVKKIPYVPISQEGGGANEALRAWTGYDNAPQAIYEEERPRIGWSELIFLAERLEANPPLVPAESRDRAFMFGLLHEIAGEMGWAWCRRLELFDPILSAPGDRIPAPLRESIDRMAAKYGYSSEAAEAARRRIPDILTLLSRTLLDQRDRDSDYFVGRTLTAVDIYWATFAAMLEPLPPEQCPMQDGMRATYTVTNEEHLAAADPILLDHRDRIYREHLKLPLEF